MIFLAASAEKYSPELLTRAQNGNADAQFWVGYAYYKGEGVTKDVNEAFKWMQKAANQSNASAQNWMGYFYDHGIGTEKNDAKTIEYYTKADNNGNGQAAYYLGMRYFDGKGVEKNPQKALELLNEALDMGSINALATLAVLSYNGEGVPQDYNRAFKLLKRCTTPRRNITDNVYVEIARDLSACYRYGRDTTVDKELANYRMVISELNGNKAVADVRSLFTVGSKII